ncbi:unnamed protein product [Protopolystoma xenopodis]|uniref:Uncharacterized protein n=1 Tax=Protopolystoma xenopodis TaxID=117903 RepID=A0A448XI57_9PLAT|nr:unnamed protein product [Protopolystoma xenopodis]
MEGLICLNGGVLYSVLALETGCIFPKMLLTQSTRIWWSDIGPFDSASHETGTSETWKHWHQGSRQLSLSKSSNPFSSSNEFSAQSQSNTYKGRIFSIPAISAASSSPLLSAPSELSSSNIPSMESSAVAGYYGEPTPLIGPGVTGWESPSLFYRRPWHQLMVADNLLSLQLRQMFTCPRQKVRKSNAAYEGKSPDNKWPSESNYDSLVSSGSSARPLFLVSLQHALDEICRHPGVLNTLDELKHIDVLLECVQEMKRPQKSGEQENVFVIRASIKDIKYVGMHRLRVYNGSLKFFFWYN